MQINKVWNVRKNLSTSQIEILSHGTSYKCMILHTFFCDCKKQNKSTMFTTVHTYSPKLSNKMQEVHKRPRIRQIDQVQGQ